MGRLIYYDNTGREISVPFGPEQPLVTIGRATDCTIQSNRKSVSRHHAEFRYNNGQYEIVDLNSSNGTYLIVNETRQPIKPRASITHLDEVWCGDFMLQFEELDDYADPGFLEPDSDPTYGDGAPLIVGGNGVASYPTGPPQGGGGFDPNYNNQSGFGQNYNQPNPSGYQDNSGYGAEPYAAPQGGQSGYGAEPYQAEPYQAEPYQPQGGGGSGYGAEPYQPAPGDEYYPDNSGGAYPGNEMGSPQPYAEPAYDQPNNSYARQGQPSGGYPSQSRGYDPGGGFDDSYDQGVGYESSGGEYHREYPSGQNEIWQEGGDTSHDHNVRDVFPNGADFNKPIASSGELSSLREQIVELEASRVALEDQLSRQDNELMRLRGELSSNRESEERLRGELEAARAEQQRLESKLDGALENAARGSALNDELEQLRKQRDDIQVLLDESQERVESYKRRVTQAEEDATRANRLRDDLRAREQDIERLRDEYDTAREELRLSEEELRKSRDETERVRLNLTNAERVATEVTDLRREVERHKRLLDEFERRNRELQAELTAVEAERDQAQEELATRTASEANLKTLAADHEKRLAEFSGEQGKLSQENKKLKSALDESRGQRAVLEKTCKRLESELAALEQSSSERINKLEIDTGGTIATLEKDLAELTQNQRVLTEERDALLAELEELTPRTKALKNEVEGLKQRLRLEKDRKRSGDDALRQENASLQEERDALKESLDARADELGTLRGEKEMLAGRLARAQSELEALQERQADAPDPAELEQVRNENAFLKRRLDEATSQLTEVSSATVEVPALRAPLESTEAHEALTRASGMLEALDRVIDAIQRTDLSGLGTVDRIRLQSALRDTDPLTTVAAIRAILDEQIS